MSAGGQSYRADIDGLRAIAVLAVAFYHAELPGFSGGYVGVDIFFVISGFLITRLIAEAAAAGRFSYLDFYERRARRILPALILMVAAVAVFNLAYKSPRDLQIFGESISLFAVFAANVFFYDQLDYFSGPAVYYPLLHTWSLAVEEQFYLLFPPLFLVLSRLAPRRVTLALGALAVMSLIASVVAVAQDPQLAFFHTPFRMWELLVGGLLALTGWRFAAPRAAEAAGWLGLALLLAPIALYDHDTPFPGLAAAPPTLGAALLIAAGATGSRVSRALSWRPVVFVGLTSYSFYLWHWPALSAARYLSLEPLSHAETAAILAGAFLVAVSSYAFVERPFRRPGAVLSRRGVFWASAASVAVFLGFGFVAQETRGLPGRFHALAPVVVEDAVKYGLAEGACAPALGALPEPARALIDPGFCRAHDAGSSAPVVVWWGDSHAYALAPGLRAAAEARGETAYLAWSAVCPPALGLDRPSATRFHDCSDHNDGVAAALAALRPSRVVLAAWWPAYAAREDFAEGFGRAVDAVRAAGAEPILLGVAPSPLVHAPTIAFRSAVARGARPLDFAEAPEEPRRAAGVSAFLTAAERVGLAPISLSAPICAAGRCAMTDAEGASLFADGHHFSRLGARRVVGSLAQFKPPG